MDLLSVIIDYLFSQNKVIFSKTDPSTITTSITILRFLKTIFTNINCFRIFALLEDNPKDNLKFIPYIFNINFLSKLYKVTAELINKVTFLKKH